MAQNEAQLNWVVPDLIYYEKILSVPYHRLAYHMEMLCRKQEWPHLFSLFLSNLPLAEIHVWAITPEPYEIDSWNITDGYMISRQ